MNHAEPVHPSVVRVRTVVSYCHSGGVDFKNNFERDGDAVGCFVFRANSGCHVLCIPAYYTVATNNNNDNDNDGTVTTQG